MNTPTAFIWEYPRPTPSPPAATVPGRMIQTYLIEFTLLGKLFQLTDLQQSDPSCQFTA